MQNRWRKLLYFLFLGGFFLVAPAVVLYTAGYRLHLSTKSIVQTGLLSLQSEPREATIFLNGELQKKKTPVVLENLLPGDYRVRMERTGFSSWEKTLTIKSRETTFAHDVLLFLDEIPHVVEKTPLRASALDATRGRIAYVKDESSWSEVWVWENTASAKTLVARYPHAARDPFELTWSVDGHFLSIKRGATQTMLIQTSTGQSVEVASIIPGAIDGWWDAKIDHHYFVKTGTRLWAIDLPDGTKQSWSNTAQTTVVRTDGNDLIFVQPTEGARQAVVSRYKSSEKIFEILTYLPTSKTYRFLPSPDGFFLLEDPKNAHLVLLEARGGEPILNVSGSFSAWDAGKRRLLYSDGLNFDLHIFDLSTRQDETITRLASPITSLAWEPNGRAVFFSQDDRLWAIELDGRDRRTTVELTSGQGIRDIFLDTRKQNVFFFGTIDGQTGIFKRRLQE